MNKTTIYTTIIASVIATLAVFAVSSSEIEAVPPFKGACPAENVQHWVNLEVIINNPLQHDTEPTIPNTRTFFPVKTMGSEILFSDIMTAKVAERLNELGYTQSDGDPVDISDIGSVAFRTNLALYSTICAEN